MKKAPTHRKALRPLKRIYIVIGIIFIAFVTWLVMRIATMDNKLEIITTYELPEFANLENLYNVDTGSYAVAVDGEVVSGVEPNKNQSTASLAKMILGLAVMQERPLGLGDKGETITIDSDARELYEEYLMNGGSVSEVETGEKISEYDALVSVFLPSSNNMADTLAIWAFGSLDEYHEYATNMLKDWGIYDTTIGEDASGFDPSTISTASDMAKIATKVMQNPVLREIVALPEYDVPVAGTINNTNRLLGRSNISGVKTGYIGEPSGYCLVSAYMENEHIITVALLGAESREDSFGDSLAIINILQEKMPLVRLASAGDVLGYYDSWWTGRVNIVATEDLYGLGWANATYDSSLEMTKRTGVLRIHIGSQEYSVNVTTAEYAEQPSIIDIIRHAFGWENNNDLELGLKTTYEEQAIEPDENSSENTGPTQETLAPITNANSANCTIRLGTLMLINPNFTVENEFIAARKTELVSISSLYGIIEGNPGNGDNLLDAEAATHINDMIRAYEAEYPGHTLETRSCFRSVGTKCGRLCAATGASDHHTGLTCDLLDPAYGTELDTDDYEQHIDWQWLKKNSYKYGYVDRFPEAWAGGSMSEPLNINAEGSTGLYETWHYRYVGNPYANEIATGKYNNGQYDSLEHYLKARGLVEDLKNGTCR